MLSLPVFHPDFGLAKVTVEPRPTLEDEAFTAQTVERMGALVRASLNHPAITSLAGHLADGCLDDFQKASRVWRWVKHRVRFRTDADTARPFAADPENTELLIPPQDLLRMRSPAGDCDDFSMLAAALLLRLGIPCSFRTVAADSASDRYSHIYVVAFTAAGPLPLDCSHGPFPGWEVKARGKIRDWRIELPMVLGSLDLIPDVLSNTNWGKITEGAFGTAGSILKARFGQPNLNPGTYVDASRGIMYRQPAGASDFAFPGVSVGVPGAAGGGMGTLILIGAAVVLVVLVAKR